MPREQVATELNVLFKRYGPLEFDSDAEATLFWRDWLADMADWPADLIEEACRQWRNSPAKYRPRTAGQLKPLIIDEWNRRRAFWSMLQEARRVEASPPPHDVGHVFEDEREEMLFKLQALRKFWADRNKGLPGDTHGIPELEEAKRKQDEEDAFARSRGFKNFREYVLYAGKNR